MFVVGAQRETELPGFYISAISCTRQHPWGWRSLGAREAQMGLLEVYSVKSSMRMWDSIFYVLFGSVLSHLSEVFFCLSLAVRGPCVDDLRFFRLRSRVNKR